MPLTVWSSWETSKFVGAASCSKSCGDTLKVTLYRLGSRSLWPEMFGPALWRTLKEWSPLKWHKLRVIEHFAEAPPREPAPPAPEEEKRQKYTAIESKFRHQSVLYEIDRYGNSTPPAYRPQSGSPRECSLALGRVAEYSFLQSTDHSPTRLLSRAL